MSEDAEKGETQVKQWAERLGPVALAGSGEYTPAMDAADRALLTWLGGPGQGRVALLPTASGREPGRPAYWNALGQEHYTRLGVSDIRPVGIIDAEGAHDPAWCDMLRDANFFYFSGGDPTHLVSSLRGSPAWDLIHAAHMRGAVLAGCSAGAMALGGRTVSPRRALMGQSPEWTAAFGIVPNVAVLPHFDRFSIGGGALLHGLAKSLPADEAQRLTLLGIDEDTALVRIPQDGPADVPWRVYGRGKVTLVTGGAKRVLRVGDETTLS